MNYIVSKVPSNSEILFSRTIFNILEIIIFIFIYLSPSFSERIDFKYSFPSVYTGQLVPGPTLLKSHSQFCGTHIEEKLALYIHRVHILRILYFWYEFHWKKKNMFMWTHAVKTHIVQGSTVLCKYQLRKKVINYYYLFLKHNQWTSIETVFISLVKISVLEWNKVSFF